MTATKLEKLLLQEISAVDDPANEIPGWQVMKARKPPASGIKFLATPEHPNYFGALTHDDAPVIKLLRRNGEQDIVRKDALATDSAGAAAATSSAPPAIPLFTRAPASPTPKFEGSFFRS